ncbi:zinc-binding alcohol dehydrogenase family protein [Sphingomonas abietis]|uniref:Zinc-binding alcohol dehydrogenase family protein n=1 Tax=Sphingomonas abietis TaxID=3012344 RepID=A0ABY7NV86_9SPHN|nr:zinc-binding alcohol dehydrogenase family protein [Sphingomonas abietis]WBO23819.1 zinc-binding alcohol dehydrogenase family protein [Sphingomonas abietis]
MVEPGAGEIAIHTRAIAVNPFDRAIRAVGDIITPWIGYPAIVGSDVAGEVVAIGTGVSRFEVGDRVLGFAAGSERGHRAAEGAYQTRVVLQEHVTSRIPDALSFEAACVLPLAIATASAALFQQDFLAMRPPSDGAAPTGATLLVWGGSTSVGCNAIQLAVAAGYDVIATASPRNHDYLGKLGARLVFDRNDPNAVASIIKALQGRRTCGAIAIGSGSTRACIDIVAASEGERFVAMVTPPTSFDAVPAGRGRWRTLLPVLVSMVIGNVRLAIRARRKGVRTKFVWGGSPVGNEVGPMVFEAFLPTALAEGRYQAAPRAEIVGDGLEAIPAALERQRRGVSASKLVVTV